MDEAAALFVYHESRIPHDPQMLRNRADFSGQGENSLSRTFGKWDLVPMPSASQQAPSRELSVLGLSPSGRVKSVLLKLLEPQNGPWRRSAS